MPFEFNVSWTFHLLMWLTENINRGFIQMEMEQEKRYNRAVGNNLTVGCIQGIVWYFPYEILLELYSCLSSELHAINSTKMTMTSFQWGEEVSFLFYG